MPYSRKIFERRWEGLSLPVVLVLVLAQGLVAGLHAYVIANPMEHIYSDMGGYISRAWRVALGEELPSRYFFYPPGTSYFFSLFLSLFGFQLGLVLIRFVQVALIAACTALVGCIAWRCYRTPWVSYTLMLFCVLYVPFAAQASFFMAEALFCFLLLHTLYLLIRPISEVPLFLCGLLLGLATLVKGQALALVAATFCYLILHRRGYRYLALLMIGFAIPLLLHWSVISHVSRSNSFYIGANDAFNMYLGQSRHKALGAYNRKDGSYFVFHNNNAGLGYPFKPPTVLFRAIDDRAGFRSDVLQLWKNDFPGQLLISCQNVVELFSIHPRWPQRNVPLLARMDTLAQWCFLLCVSIPALCALLSRNILGLSRTVLLASPLLFVAVICGVTMGQPRYLLPFHYCLILLAGSFYLEISKPFSRYIRRQSR